jgi:hypothetical protein
MNQSRGRLIGQAPDLPGDRVREDLRPGPYDIRIESPMCGPPRWRLDDLVCRPSKTRCFSRYFVIKEVQVLAVPPDELVAFTPDGVQDDYPHEVCPWV